MFDLDFGEELPSLGTCTGTVATHRDWVGKIVFPALEPFLAV
jgi:hypothetical protein